MKNSTLPVSIEDVSKSILWQYEHAERLKQIIAMIQDATNASSVALWKKMFYAFNLDENITPDSFDYEFRVNGLHAISMLFGLSRPLWRRDGQIVEASINVWRRYLKGMIWLMDSDGSCSDINKWISIIFPNIKFVLTDNLDMTISYSCYQQISEDSEDWALMNIDGFFPRPAGVQAILNWRSNDAIFGTENQNLGQLNSSRFGPPKS